MYERLYFNSSAKRAGRERLYCESWFPYVEAQRRPRSTRGLTTTSRYFVEFVRKVFSPVIRSPSVVLSMGMHSRDKWDFDELRITKSGSSVSRMLFITRVELTS